MKKQKWQISAKRQALFIYPEAADPYQVLAHQMDIARPKELGALYMMRDDAKQREAMLLVQQAKTAAWTRRMVLYGIPLTALVSAVVGRL